MNVEQEKAIINFEMLWCGLSSLVLAAAARRGHKASAKCIPQQSEVKVKLLRIETIIHHSSLS
jgi:hypothetical protein